MPRRVLAITFLLALIATASMPGSAIESGPPPTPAAPGLLGHQVLGSDQGLPQLTVLAIASDRAGVLYVGTLDGLARYDGRRFERVALGAAVARQAVHHLLVDSQDRLWVGGDRPGLHRFEQGVVARIDSTDGQVLPTVQALAISRWSERIWVGTDQGVFLCDAACEPLAESAELQAYELLEGEGADTGVLWIGSNFDGVYRFLVDDRGQVQAHGRFLDARQGLPNGAIRGLAYFPNPGETDPALWIATGRGVARWQHGRLRVYGQAQGFPGSIPMALARGYDARAQRPTLLVATLGAGLIEFADADRYRVLGPDHGLPDANLYSLLTTGIGTESIVWLGSADAGLIRLEPGRVTVYDERHGLPQRPLASAGVLRFADGLDTVWASATSGSARLEADGRWRSFLPATHARAALFAALRDPAGRLWFGTSIGLLLRDTDGRWHSYTFGSSALPAVRITHLAWSDASGGTLWMGSNHGMARWRAGQIERLWSDRPELAGIGINALLAWPRGADPDVLVATGLGLYRIADDVIAEVALSCLDDPDIRALAAINGRLWLGTPAGAARVDLDAQPPHCAALAEAGIDAPLVNAIGQDRRGRVYLFGYDGARRIVAADAVLADPVQTAMERFGLAEGLPSLGFGRSAVLAPDGRLMAANSAGLVVFDGDDPVPAPAAPTVHLSVRLDGEAAAKAIQRLPFDHEELLFDYRLLSFRRESHIRYRSRLHGLEAAATGWIETAQRRFSRLPPGQYRFELLARDADGREHGPAEYAFQVLGPWWLHPATLAAVGVAVLLLGLGVGRWRARTLAARARRLEAVVAERTGELAVANERLYRASLIDPLTGAGNRRCFYDKIADWLSASADGGGVWLLLIDIDHFKAINDRYGHAGGDAVLVEVARRLRALGEVEVIRWGGEEFLLVWPQAGRVDAHVPALAVLSAVASAPVATGSAEVAVRCSVGITRCRPPSAQLAEHIDSIVARADQALYEAKRSGRDRAFEASQGAVQGMPVLRQINQAPGFAG